MGDELRELVGREGRGGVGAVLATPGYERQKAENTQDETQAARAPAASVTRSESGWLTHRAYATGRASCTGLPSTPGTGDEAAAVKRRLHAKYIKREALDDIGRAWDRFDDVVVEVSPAGRQSWTGSVLHAETQRELTADYDDVWLED